MDTELPEDPQRRRLHERLEEILTRAAKAATWQRSWEESRPLQADETLPDETRAGEKGRSGADAPVGAAGGVVVSGRLDAADVEFLTVAGTELLGFAELGLRLLDLHSPRDAGGITSDSAHPILRCRSCMWRWPCPTFRAINEAFGPPEPEGGAASFGVPSFMPAPAVGGAGAEASPLAADGTSTTSVQGAALPDAVRDRA
jgi:hypothetical protein